MNCSILIDWLISNLMTAHKLDMWETKGYVGERKWHWEFEFWQPCTSIKVVKKLKRRKKLTTMVWRKINTCFFSGVLTVKAKWRK